MSCICREFLSHDILDPTNAFERIWHQTQYMLRFGWQGNIYFLINMSINVTNDWKLMNVRKCCVSFCELDISERQNHAAVLFYDAEHCIH